MSRAQLLIKQPNNLALSSLHLLSILQMTDFHEQNAGATRCNFGNHIYYQKHGSFKPLVKICEQLYKITTKGRQYICRILFRQSASNRNRQFSDIIFLRIQTVKQIICQHFKGSLNIKNVLISKKTEQETILQQCMSIVKFI